jgi:protein ImuB
MGGAPRPGDGPVRTLVVRCDDWPVVAAGCSPADPVAVVHANRVVATSPAARAEGVARHQRRREAQSRCPALVVVERDEARDARVFEPVVAALDALTPRVELTIPGQVAFPTRGPSRFFGGDDAVVARALEVVGAAVGEVSSGPVRVRAGVADGPFAAALAARTARPAHVVAPGETPAFLAELPMAALERPELVDVLGRLGLRRLGDLAARPGRAGPLRHGGPHRLAAGRRAGRAAAVHRAAAGRPHGVRRARPPGGDGRARCVPGARLG